MTTLRVRRVHGHPGATALTFEAGAITAIGSSEEDAGPAGGVIVPAFRDAHIHPVGVAAAAARLDLSDARSLSEVADLIATRAALLPDGVPVVAHGLDDEAVAEGRMPLADDLDDTQPDRPVLVYRHCTHVASVNHAALAAAGVGDATPDPVGGRLRRTAGGRVTGVLEESAIALVSDPLARSAPAPDVDGVLGVLHGLRRRGVVAIDAMVAVGSSLWCTGGNEFDVLASLDDRCPVDVGVHVITRSEKELRSAAARLTGGKRVRFAGWKAFADGSLGGRTAALRHPYADDPATSGLDRVRQEPLDTLARVAVELGGTAAIHAIGDLAVEHAVGLAERLGPGTVRIEHASVTDQHQIARMARARAIASVQPSFATSDAEWLPRRLGERARWAYPFQTMHQAGVELRGGSDAPIEDPNPFVGIRDAVADRPEALTLDQAIDLYAAHPIRVGGPATFVLVDRDPHTVGSDIPGLQIRGVWLEGEQVE